MRFSRYDLVITDLGRLGSSHRTTAAGSDLLDHPVIIDGGPPVVVYGSWNAVAQSTELRARGAFGVAADPESLYPSGWYGKQFDSPDAVHPLLFQTPKGTLFPVNPARIPLSLAGRVPIAAVSATRRLLDVAMPLLRAHEPKARLRNLEHRGKVTAAMIYDQLPIINVFRRIDDATLLGLMDMRAVAQPYFFVLTCD